MCSQNFCLAKKKKKKKKMHLFHQFAFIYSVINFRLWYIITFLQAQVFPHFFFFFRSIYYIILYYIINNRGLRPLVVGKKYFFSLPPPLLKEKQTFFNVPFCFSVIILLIFITHLASILVSFFILFF